LFLSDALPHNGVTRTLGASYINQTEHCTMETTITSPHAVYVGTYAKYNDGNISGDWLSLEDYANKEDFLAACKALHNDEADPELMFQDWEGVPDGMISECSLSDEIFDFIQMDDKDKHILVAYRENIDQGGSLEDATEAYQGTFSSKEDFAEDLFCNCYTIPKELENYIDYGRVVRDLECGDYTFVYDGGDYLVFRNV
jgi:antirestriction protein